MSCISQMRRPHRTTARVQHMNRECLLVACKLEPDSNSLRAKGSGFPFLLFPAEIRNLIYGYALGGATLSVCTTPIEPRAAQQSRNALAILQVNRQVHSEAWLSLYTCNTFEGTHDGHLRDWLRTLRPEQRHAIRSIKCHLRGHIISTTSGLAASPALDMNVLCIGDWELKGLTTIEIEMVLNPWSGYTHEEELAVAKTKTVCRLAHQMRNRLPGVAMNIHLHHER